MPIYEFYCPHCHTIFSFLSRSVDTEKRPPCPGCAGDVLSRRISRFAVVSRKSGEGADGEPDDLPIDESKMERAMGALAAEAEHLNEEDPRAAARLMRKFSDMTGVRYADSMEKALCRLEAGEDPESVEADMGEALEGEENPFIAPSVKKLSRSLRTPPRRDETLYEM